MTTIYSEKKSKIPGNKYLFHSKILHSQARALQQHKAATLALSAYTGQIVAVITAYSVADNQQN